MFQILVLKKNEIEHYMLMNRSDALNIMYFMWCLYMWSNLDLITEEEDTIAKPKMKSRL